MKLVQEGNRSFDLVQRRVYRLAPILIPAEYESAEYVTFFGFNGCVGGSVQPLITNEGSVFDFLFFLFLDSTFMGGHQDRIHVV